MILSEGKPSLLMFSALGVPPFRSVKLRAKRPTCAACGSEGEMVGSIAETDYVALCGGQRPDWLSRGLLEGSPHTRIQAKVRGELRGHLVYPLIAVIGTQSNFERRGRLDKNIGCSPTHRVWDLPHTGVYE